MVPGDLATAANQIPRPGHRMRDCPSSAGAARLPLDGPAGGPGGERARHVSGVRPVPGRARPADRQRDAGRLEAAGADRSNRGLARKSRRWPGCVGRLRATPPPRGDSGTGTTTVGLDTRGLGQRRRRSGQLAGHPGAAGPPGRPGHAGGVSRRGRAGARRHGDRPAGVRPGAGAPGGAEGPAPRPGASAGAAPAGPRGPRRGAVPPRSPGRRLRGGRTRRRASPTW